MYQYRFHIGILTRAMVWDYILDRSFFAIISPVHTCMNATVSVNDTSQSTYQTGACTLDGVSPLLQTAIKDRYMLMNDLPKPQANVERPADVPGDSSADTVHSVEAKYLYIANLAKIYPFTTAQSTIYPNNCHTEQCHHTTMAKSSGSSTTFSTNPECVVNPKAVLPRVLRNLVKVATYNVHKELKQTDKGM